LKWPRKGNSRLLPSGPLMKAKKASESFGSGLSVEKLVVLLLTRASIPVT
jgi:hypothetical protein